MKRQNAMIIVSALLLAALTACNNGDEVADGSGNGPIPMVKTEAATPEAEPTATGPTVTPLTGTVTYVSGIKVTLSKFSRAVSSDSASPESTPYARFTVTVVNGSKQQLDLGQIDVECQYGDTEGKASEEVFDFSSGLEGGPDTALLPGRTSSFPIGCELPKDQSYLQVEIMPGWDSETAIFAGKVQK